MTCGIALKQTSKKRSQNNHRTIFSAALFTACNLAIQSTSAAMSEDGLRLKQMSSACGQQNVLLAPHYFKIELPKKSLQIIGAAPDWKILTLNTRSKLFCETPLNAFEASYITTSTQLHLTELILMREIASRAKHVKMQNGLDCIDYPVGQIDHSFNAFKDARSSVYRVLNYANLPKPSGKVVKRLCGLNSFKTDLFPITLEIVNQDGFRNRFLWTAEISPVKNVKPEAVPKGYTKVGKEIEVFRDAQVQAEIKDILDAP